MIISRKIQRECKVCGKKFIIFRAWLRKDGRGGLFCSRMCQRKGKIKRLKNIIIKECKICKKEFKPQPCRAKTASYCSIQCMAIGRGKRMRGKNHPNWKGGVSKRDSRSRIWAKRVKQRDKECVDCGSKNNIQAHHKKEWAENKDLRYDLNNGETLCSICHALRHPRWANMIRVPNIRSGIMKNCLKCDQKFYAKPSLINIAKFCSHKCQREVLWQKLRLAPKKRVNCLCEVCGKQYSQIPSVAKRGTRWCGRECQYKGLSIINTKII